MRLRTILGVALLAASASAQLAQSANYRLDDFALAGGGGGAASTGFAAFLALEPMSGAEVTSPNFRATLGFLGAWDPQPTNAPVIFGVTPDCGPLAGGTPVTVTGLNFQKPGAGATSVVFGAAAASGVAIASDTVMTCATPAGAAGDASLSVSNAIGSDVLAAAFHYTAGLEVYGTGTPGCTGSELMSATTCPNVNTPSFALTCDHAPPLSLGLGLIGNVQDAAGSDPLAFGVLFHMSLFDPGLIGLNFTSDAAGLGFVSAPIPNNPTFVGVSVYGQAVWYWSFGCPLGPLSLSASRGLKITFEP